MYGKPLLETILRRLLGMHIVCSIVAIKWSIKEELEKEEEVQSR